MPASSRRTFERVYLGAVIVLVCATGLIPALEIITYPLLGFDPALLEAYSVESFQAARATAPLRRGFGWACVGLALVVAGMSLVAQVRRWRRGRGVPWPASLALCVIALAVALLIFGGLMAPSGICC